jgi:hypothetical protein
MGFRAMTINKKSADRVRFTYPPKTHLFAGNEIIVSETFIVKSIYSTPESSLFYNAGFITASHIMRYARRGAENERPS